jgi:hypothetical protein
MGVHSDIAVRCHEIQAGLGLKEVPDFDSVTELGMAVRLALHLRGLPAVRYDTLKQIAYQLLYIPLPSVKNVLAVLAEVEFVTLATEGKSIKNIIPTVPYYEDMYATLNEYGAAESNLNEIEELSVDLMRRLANSPENLDTIRNAIGADKKAFDRAIQIGQEGSYLVKRRSRGRDILLNPTYFSSNANVFADLVAAGNSKSIPRVLKALKAMQGVPLSLILRNKEIAGIQLDAQDLEVLVRLAEDGAVKPPQITTTYSGKNNFMFTPTPSGAAMADTKTDIYERAMAIVAAIRQGQLLSQQFAIRSPGAVAYKLKTELKLRATTEATQQYRNLVTKQIGRLRPSGGGFTELQIIDTEENNEALSIAYDLINEGESKGVEVDEEARSAFLGDNDYLDSVLASKELRTRELLKPSAEAQLELNLYLSQ